MGNYPTYLDGQWFGIVADYDPATNTGTDNSAALGTAIDEAVESGRPLRLPPGKIRLANRVVRSYAEDCRLTIDGINADACRFYVDGTENGDGAIRVSITDTTKQALIKLKNFSVWNRGDAAANMNCGTAIELVRTPVPGLRVTREVEFDNVFTHTHNNDDGYFDKGFVVTGFRFPMLHNCRMENPFGPGVSGAADRHRNTWIGYLATSCFEFNDCYGPVAAYCHGRSAETGFVFNSATGEGGELFMCQAVDVKKGGYKTGAGHEPGFSMIRCHMNYRDHGFHCNKGKLFQFDGNLFYNENVGTDGATHPADFWFEDFEESMILYGNTSHFDGAGAANRSLVRCDNAGAGRRIVAVGNAGTGTFGSVFRATAADVAFDVYGNNFPGAANMVSNNGVAEMGARLMPHASGFIPTIQGSPTGAAIPKTHGLLLDHNDSLWLMLIGSSASGKERGIVFGDPAQPKRAEFYVSANGNSLRARFLGGNETHRLSSDGSVDIVSGTDKSYKVGGVKVIDNSAGIRLPAYTAANIASVSHAVNTADKVAGKMVWDTTNNRVMVASGSTPASPWFAADGAASVTPA